MIRIAEYKKGDVFLINAREEMRMTKEMLEMIDFADDYGVFHSFMVGNDVVAAIGGTLLWSGNMSVWSVIGDSALKYPKSLFSLTKKTLELYSVALKLNRMEMSVRKDFHIAYDWALRLGFMPEGLMKNYLPGGQDAYMFARYFK